MHEIERAVGVYIGVMKSEDNAWCDIVKAYNAIQSLIIILDVYISNLMS